MKVIFEQLEKELDKLQIKHRSIESADPSCTLLSTGGELITNSEESLARHIVRCIRITADRLLQEIDPQEDTIVIVKDKSHDSISRENGKITYIFSIKYHLFTG